MELILNVQYGGLGDNLFLSPIPRLFKQKYPDGRIYLSEDSKFRSKEIKQIIWDLNPFLDGYTSKKGIVPSVNFGKPGMNILSLLSNSIGLTAENDLRPEIYYKPILIKTLSGSTLLDLNYASFVGSYSKSKILSLLMSENNIVNVNPPEWAKDIGLQITTKNLRHYIDIIFSSEKFICFTSGGATLSDAISKPTTCIYGYGQNNIFHHSPIHKYVPVYSSSLIRIPHSGYLRVKNKLRVLLTE